ncbi:MAG: hypothetical protein ABI981_12205 [Betaproteobacteria bacterium]
MNALATSSAVLAVVLAGAALGAILRRVLPPTHMSEDSKDVVKLGIGVIATLAALVLGLLIASAKGSFDTKSEEIKESAARIIVLDRTLRQYGPETVPIRETLRSAVLSKVNLHWVEGTGMPDAEALGNATSEVSSIERMQQMLWMLAPTSELQRALRARAVQLSAELSQMRWMLLEQKGSSIALPFVVVLVFWLAVIFGSFGLFAPPNATVYSVIFICALSVSSAIFLILELDRPFDGLLMIPDAPLRSAIGELSR